MTMMQKSHASAQSLLRMVRNDQAHSHKIHQPRRAAADPDPGSAGAGVCCHASSMSDVSNEAWYEALVLARWLAWWEPGPKLDPNSVEVYMEAQRLLEQ